MIYVFAHLWPVLASYSFFLLVMFMNSHDCSGDVYNRGSSGNVHKPWHENNTCRQSVNQRSVGKSELADRLAGATVRRCHVADLNKKVQHRSWHTAKCNKLYHLKWNINTWDTAIPLHGRHCVRHLEICNQILSNFYNWCPVSLRTIQWKKRSLHINRWLSYGQL